MQLIANRKFLSGLYMLLGATAIVLFDRIVISKNYDLPMSSFSQEESVSLADEPGESVIEQPEPGDIVDDGTGLRSGDASIAADSSGAVIDKKEDWVKDNALENTPLHIKKGDNLNGLLTRAGIKRAQIVKAISALKKHFDPRTLNSRHALFITTSDSDDGLGKNLLSLSIRVDFENEVIVTQDESGNFSAEKIKRDITREHKIIFGKIKDGFYVDAIKSGAHKEAVAQAIKALSYDVDFQRSIKQGDTFKIMYDVLLDRKGGEYKVSDVSYVKLKMRGRTSELFLYKNPKTGTVDYYDKNGVSAKKSLLRTPVKFYRISSRFGMRRHPILGYNKMHKGVDFAAPTGTPIIAAGDGVVEKAYRSSSFGNFIQIRHSNKYRTAYAHMQKFARGMRPGKRVRQGQVIGYVGQTGRASGPHLHFEVKRGAKHLNPMKIKGIPGTKKLNRNDLQKFKLHLASLNKKILELEKRNASGITSSSGQIIERV